MRAAPATVEAPAASAATVSSPNRLTVEVRRDCHLHREDALALDTLMKHRPETGVFLSRAWLSGLFAEPGDGCEAWLVLLRDGNALRGIVPLAVHRRVGSVTVRSLGGGIGSDRVDLIAARGFEVMCADALITWLGETFGRRAFILELRDVPGDSPLWGAMHRANDGDQRKLALQPREIYTLPYLRLSEALPIKSLEKHRRWLERRGRLRIETLTEAGDVMAAFESLTQFLHARWRDSAEGSALDRPRSQRFHRHVLPLLLRDGHLRMIRLSSDMRTVAVFYGLAVGSWRGYYLAGYDRGWAGRIHLGQITLNSAIELAKLEGAAEFDFLKGVERVKYLWPVRERSSLDADIYSDHPASHLSRAARAAREGARALVKSARVAGRAASR